MISPKETLKHNLNSVTQKLMTNTDFSISFPNGECFACIQWENIPQNPNSIMTERCHLIEQDGWCLEIQNK